MKSPGSRQEPQQGQKEFEAAALQAPRRPTPPALAHYQAQVKGRHVHQQSLENIGVTSQVDAPHPAGLIQMSKAPFQLLAALPQ